MLAASVGGQGAELRTRRPDVGSDDEDRLCGVDDPQQAAKRRRSRDEPLTGIEDDSGLLAVVRRTVDFAVRLRLGAD